jgi:ribonucleoside-triphosphate reductase
MSNLPTPYQQFIHLSRYSRWLEDEGRRESWEETVDRYIGFFKDHLERTLGYKMGPTIKSEIREAILGLEVMPSMRCLMTAGEALRKDAVAGYNCSYLAINRVRAFDEVLYALMCGTGVGFSVERDYVSKLPTIAEEFEDSDTTIVVQDSRIGWCKAFRELVSLLITGRIPKWDMSRVRPSGSRLKTFGGRSSGPESLDDLFRFTVEIFKRGAGRKLTSIECHDLVCKIAEIVVVGGVRRSALLSLSSLTDERMRVAKQGQWWVIEPQRALSNNSVCYKEKPDIGIFMEEWLALYKSKSGERGIFNRESAQKTVAKTERRDPDHEFGTNPCSEIILRDREFCNLSEIVARGDDTIDSLKRKVRLAAIIGTWQSTLTDFRYLSADWRKNCEEERLLGVSITGIMDSILLNGSKSTIGKLPALLEELKQIAVDTNKEWASRLGINPSVAITCVKPSGTVSQLVDSASGIHARHNPHYVRTVRASSKDPLCKFMIDKGFPNEPCHMKPDTTMVFSFPVESPKNAIFRKDMSALEQLDLWLLYQKHWCEHKPSITVSVKEEEWLDVGAWVYNNFDDVCGVSFLPFSDHSYKQAPYQDCSKQEYKDLLKQMPKDIDWNDLKGYEVEDNTAGSQTLACSGNSCEVVDLTN